jgi:hypothetical protein
MQGGRLGSWRRTRAHPYTTSRATIAEPFRHFHRLLSRIPQAKNECGL